MKYLSRKDLEVIARRTIQAYMELPEYRGQAFWRIDPEDLAKRLFGLKVCYEHLSLDRETLGLTSFEEIGIEVFSDTGESSFYLLDGKTILIEKDLITQPGNRGRCNFSIAHENAHQILNSLSCDDWAHSARDHEVWFHRENVSFQWSEWQADTLASLLLMPQEIVLRSMKLFDLGEKVHLLNRVFAPVQYERFRALADFLGVSLTALAIRMKKLGLLEREYLSDPYRLIDVH